MFGDSNPTGTKSFIMQKAGPMPVWAWGLAGLGAAVAYYSWKKNKAATAQATSSTDPTLIGGDQTPPVVFQNYTTVLNTDNDVPPGSGRPHPPVHVPVPPLPPGRPIPSPSPPPTGGGGPIKTPGVPATPAPAAGTWVTVAKYTTQNPVWNSTLWGIASHFGYGNSSTNWSAVWNAPQNAALVSRRKQPTSIQPGDSIFVPAK
jgi:hypothetical protein